MFYRYCSVFHFYISLLLTSYFFDKVLSNTLEKDDDEILKKSLLPLKYPDGSCEEFCQNILCQPIECNNGVIVEKETYCGCCEACVKFLDIGDNCTEVIEGSLALGPKSRCKHGTICKDGKCQLKDTEESCERHRDIRIEHKKTENYESEIWIPQCDEKGYYAAKQKKITRSFCFNTFGKRIFGSPEDSLSNTCGCSRYIEDIIEKDPEEFHVKPHEHCSSTGNFDTLQCIGNLCYCADENTGDIKSELVRIDFLQNLNCSVETIPPEEYLTDCEKELQRTKKLANDFKKKGVTIHGIDKVACDPDGSFAPRQTRPERYVCTDKKGHGISNYNEELTKIPKDKMTCNCARDGQNNPYQTLSCETYGSYQIFTCFPDDKCVCVDEDGESIEPKELKEPNIKPNDVCKNVLENLLKYPNNDEGSTETVDITDYPDYDPNDDPDYDPNDDPDE